MVIILSDAGEWTQSEPQWRNMDLNIRWNWVQNAFLQSTFDRSNSRLDCFLLLFCWFLRNGFTKKVIWKSILFSFTLSVLVYFSLKRLTVLCEISSPIRQSNRLYYYVEHLRHWDYIGTVKTIYRLNQSGSSGLPTKAGNCLTKSKQL